MTTDERRARVASALRALGHDFVDHEVDDDELTSMADEVEALLARVRRGARRPRRAGVESDTVEDVNALHLSLAHDALVGGPGNPMGLGARHWYDGDEAVMEVEIGRAFEGAPGRGHGGVLAMLVDETMGYVLAHHGIFALTGWLRIDYRDAAPLGVPVRARAHLASREGRKLTIEARVESGSTLVAEAQALFIAVNPRRFGTSDA